jgi:S1-C subfamily serine protease
VKWTSLWILILFMLLVSSCVSIHVIDEPRDQPQRTDILVEQLEQIEDSFFRLLLALGHIQTSAGEQLDQDLEDEPGKLDVLTGLIERAYQQLIDQADPRAQDVYEQFGQRYSFITPDLPIQTSNQRFLTRLPEEPKSLWAHRVFQKLSFPQTNGAALSSQPNQIDHSVQDQDEYSSLIELATLLNHRDLKDQLGIPHRGFLPVDSLRAVVTVLVDQGIQLTRGIGRPNIVVGSGFFIDPDGYIITNYHVIQSQVDPTYQGVSRLTVRLYSTDGRAVAQRVPARVVGYDELLDIALLKTEAIPPGIVSLGTMAAVQPGAEVLAIGSPGGLENTLTRGIVSAMGRRFLQIGEVYQVDIPLNPGNSGGPVFDRTGRVVGVVFAGIQQFDGVNFIIPSDRILEILPQLFTPGQISHSWIGTSVHELPRGLSVSFISPQSVTRTSSLQIGDVIRSINGLPVRTIPQAQSLIAQHSPGSFINLEIDRNGRMFTIPVPIESRPVYPMAQILGQTLASRWLLPLFGMDVLRLDNRGGRPAFQVRRVFPGSVAAESGITELDSFSLIRWIYDEEQRVAAIQIMIERKNSGMMPEGLQLAVFIGLSNFL